MTGVVSSSLRVAALACVLALAGATGLVQAQGASVEHMQRLIDAVRTGNTEGLSAEQRQALETGAQSARVAADLTQLDSETVDFVTQHADQWQRMAREAYVAALPPRDQARGASILLGDGTLPDAEGRLFYFVSRSMPMSLLRAYAVEALHTGGVLVVKGIRRGDTIKEYVEEAVADFNNADGQVLAGLEINPNLFDMFGVEVVPTVVWTNRIGLDDIGSGCEDLPEAAPKPQLRVTGPDSQPMYVEQPVCAPAPESSYFKIAGALTTQYVLDRFEQAGAPAVAMAHYRGRLADWHANVFDGSVGQRVGNAMPRLADNLTLEVLPRHVLWGWYEELQKKNVRRGPYGPAFTLDEEDDAAYREELMTKVRRSLAL